MPKILVFSFIVAFLIKSSESMHLPPGFTFNDQNCNLEGVGVGLIGSEDLALGRHGVLFITSGDLSNTFSKGAALANPGGLWVLDMRKGGSPDPSRIQIQSSPEGKLFQHHGLDVFNTTDKVYAISHNGDYSSVDIFKIAYNLECLASLPWACTPVSLTFVRSVISNIFPNYGINDVVAAEENKIYVSQWQPFSLFPGQTDGGPDGWKKKFPGLVGLKMTNVFYCTWVGDYDEAMCEVATASHQKFMMANGLTVNQDSSKVYVNDLREKVIMVMERDVKGKLTKGIEIRLPFGADNIEYDDEADEIIIGTLDLVAEGQGGGVLVAGGMAVAQKYGLSGWVVREVLSHDGSQLNQISAAARLGDKIVLGSPVSEGILICNMDQVL